MSVDSSPFNHTARRTTHTSTVGRVATSAAHPSLLIDAGTGRSITTATATSLLHRSAERALSMATKRLNNKSVAVLATNGFEHSELVKPVEALKKAGATVHIVSPHTGTIRGWNGENWAEDTVNVDVPLNDAKPDDYDALVLPGGVANPDSLRQNQKAVSFAKSFFEQGKPVSAICHGPQLLIECDVLQGRSLTSYPSIKTDLKNAGARWMDVACHCDQGLTTSRTPDDLPEFIEKTIEEIAEGKHSRQRTA